MAELADKVLVEQRAKLRSALKKEFQKQLTHPFLHKAGEGGTIFDPAIQRYSSMRVTLYDHFRPTPKTTGLGMLLAVIPILGFTWLLTSSRAKIEHTYRTGQVAYVDRTFKFQ